MNPTIRHQQNKIEYKKEKMYLTVGLVIGLMSGILGNLFVTSIYRWIDKEPFGHNGLTALVSFIGVVIITTIFIKFLKKLEKE